MLLPTQNKQFARKYYESLPADDVNRQYYENGVKYTSQNQCSFGYSSHCSIYNKIQTLSNFYPYEQTVQATKKEYLSDWSNAFKNSAIFTGVSWFGLFQAARQGYVLPLGREYGRFFKTHRIFRHYIWFAVLPIIYHSRNIGMKYYFHVEHLWKIHANRLNQKILDDPDTSIYPKEIREKKRRNFQQKSIFKENMHIYTHEKCQIYLQEMKKSYQSR